MNGWSPHNKTYLEVATKHSLGKDEQMHGEGEFPPPHARQAHEIPWHASSHVDAVRLDPRRVLVLQTIAETSGGGPLLL